MALSIYAANKFLNVITRREASVSFGNAAFLGFLVNAPTESASGAQTWTEPYSPTILDNGYARISIGASGSQNNSSMTSAVNGACYNDVQIAGTECINEDWPGIRCFGIFDQKTAGNLICWGYLQDSEGQPLVNPVYVTQGKIPVFRIGALHLSFALTEN